MRDAAVAALDYIDRNCDEFLEQQEEPVEEESALGPVLRKMSVDGEDVSRADPDPAAVADLRRRLEEHQVETRRLAETHARTAAELAKKSADYDELRLRLGAVEAERIRRAANAKLECDTDKEADGFVIVTDQANPTGASPPVPPPEYCVINVVASD